MTDVAIRLAVVGLFAYWSLVLIAPFAVVVVWAVILAVSLQPAYTWLRARLGDRGVPAATLITVAGLLIVVVPAGALSLKLGRDAQELVAKLNAGTIRIPTPPAGVADWPVIGERVHAAWAVAATSVGDALRPFVPQLVSAGTAILAWVASVGGGLLMFALSVVIAGFLYGAAQRIRDGLRRFADRLDPKQGAGLVDLAAATIRNVSRGVIGVAVLQTLLAGFVLAAFDVPASGALAFAVLILCLVQIGPLLVLLPVVVWGWTALETGGALLLTLLLVPIAVIDNVLKPILMARGLSTPMLVILVGVIGGTLAHGLIGLFLGPIVLAVFYELLVAWVRGGTADAREALGVDGLLSPRGEPGLTPPGSPGA